jgi:type I restriction enzyme S subunit
MEWEHKKFDEICCINPPKKEARDKLSPEDQVSFVPMENLGILTKYFNAATFKALKDVASSYTYFANNDVLLAKITPCFENGKIGIARNLKNGIGFGSSEFLVCRTNGEVIPEYIYYYLTQNHIRSNGKKVMAGAVGHKRIPKEYIQNLIISFPKSFEEQDRIVSILDKAFAAIDKAKVNTEQNLKNVKELFANYLQKVILENKEYWESAELNQHVKFIDYRGKTPIKTQSGFRLITAKNVRMGFLKEEPREYVDPNSYQKWMTRGIPKQGDVLFTTEAPLANVCQLDTNEKVVFAQRIIIMQPNLSVIDNEFLKFLLLSQPIQKSIHEKGTGATATGIKASQLKKIPIYYPSSIQQQKMITGKLNQLDKLANSLERNFQQKLNYLNELKKSILQKAFTGELTNTEVTS